MLQNDKAIYEGGIPEYMFGHLPLSHQFPFSFPVPLPQTFTPRYLPYVSHLKLFSITKFPQMLKSAFERMPFIIFPS